MRHPSARSALVLSLLLLPTLAYAQDEAPAEALREGRRSITFSLPSGGGTAFGLWTMRSARTNLGLEVGLTAQRTEPQNADARTRLGLSVGPAIKRYLAWTASPVAPLLYGGVNVGWSREKAGGTTLTGLSAGVSGGIGVEWFPTRRVSIGGYTGLRADYGRSTRSYDAPVDDVTSSQLNVTTFHSALMLHIYFGGPEEPRRPGIAEARP